MNINSRYLDSFYSSTSIVVFFFFFFFSFFLLMPSDVIELAKFCSYLKDVERQRETKLSKKNVLTMKFEHLYSNDEKITT